MIHPVIEWDDDEFGGFRVTSNLDHFIAPGDWVVDPADTSHFVPKYKPCKYRRLSYGNKKGRPWCHIHCLLFEEVVDQQTCIDCTERVDPPKSVPIEDLISIEEGDIAEDVERKFQEARQRQYDEENPYDPYGTEIITNIGDVMNPPDDDPVFSKDQPSSRYVTKSTQRTKWAPCIHRQESKNTDCSGCNKFICGCEACPLLGKTLSKKDCAECSHRTEN